MTEQHCYDIGYDNPRIPTRELAKQHKFNHVVDVNACWAGQMDRQNQLPRNPDYRREDYDAVTGERV